MSLGENLFEPGRIGDLVLPNRLVMAPLGRARSDLATRAPLERVATYYGQRASAGLIVSEATHVSPFSVSRPGGSAIHTQAQIAGWKQVTKTVHRQGGRIFQQLFHLGRKAHVERLPDNRIPIAPSAIAAIGDVPVAGGLAPFPVPRALETGEIQGIIDEFHLAAVNSRAADFDGVEIHAANGYLIDQFLRDRSNRRQDLYGGSIENRARFLLAIVDAAVNVFGASRVGVRISPHFTQDGIDDSNPASLYGYVAQELDRRRIAYLHVIEPDTIAPPERIAPHLRTHYSGALILCGEFTHESGERALTERRADFIAFGRLYIANPDLVARFRLQAPLNAPDPATFYSGGDEGYIDYPSLTPALAEVS
ncbi:alkene reductase [Beijerinckia indica]|uniref:NADH:flavin oxidoreductase/NADH oxidase n=1 Tax=Beijerinckia indica subsp. indica (strain ATCC 9039 / DSM 1715 / NCIMB 8712) TaxID=395963 RepID=B2IHN3_BEII9|nr:alkene reductase [Beijerinckia indica]ACB94554.1 NADH:flavin oxidoreductase/NADH oxidase [Beijerinckia indica subsp. indica ATCC 9039]